MAVTAAEWVRRFAELIGTEAPDPDELEALLALAGEAAHASERTAAPVTCWLAARAGMAPADALGAAKGLAEKIAETAGGEPPDPPR